MNNFTEQQKPLSKEQYYQSKRIVITGGAGDIGSAVANLLSSFGSEVTTIDVRDNTQDEKQIRGRNIIADVSDRDMLFDASANINYIDMLIIAAGITSETDEPTQVEMERMNGVNIDGVRNILDIFGTTMKEGSNVVFIGTDNPSKIYYRKTKEQGRNLVRAFSDANPNIRVQTILLGPVNTDLFRKGKSPEQSQRIADHVGMYEPNEFAEELADLLMQPHIAQYQEKVLYGSKKNQP